MNARVLQTDIFIPLDAHLEQLSVAADLTFRFGMALWTYLEYVISRAGRKLSRKMRRQFHLEVCGKMSKACELNVSCTK